MGRGGGADWRGGRGGRGGSRGGFTPGAGRGQDPNNANMPQRAPPPNYICFRCGEKGTEKDHEGYAMVNYILNSSQ